MRIRKLEGDLDTALTGGNQASIQVLHRELTELRGDLRSLRAMQGPGK